MITILASMILQNIIFASNTIIDNIMTAHLGEAYIAAMSSSATFIAIIFGILEAFSIFSAGAISKNYFKEEHEGIGKNILIGLITNLVISLIFVTIYLSTKSMIVRSFGDFQEVSQAAKAYLNIMIFNSFLLGIKIFLINFARSVGFFKIVLYSAIINLISNIFLNHIFINILNLSILGSAIATVLSDILTIIFTLFIVRKKLELYSASFRDWIIYLKGALPFAVFGALLSLSSMLIQNAFGRISKDALTSFGIVVLIDIMILSIFRGIASSSILILSEDIAKGKDIAYESAKKIIRIGILTAIAIGSLLIIFSKSIVSSIFNIGSDNIVNSAILVKIYGIFLTFQGVNVIFRSGILSLGEDTVFIMVSSLLVDWIITIPVIYSLIFTKNMFLIHALFCSADVLSFVIILRRFRKKKWLIGV